MWSRHRKEKIQWEERGSPFASWIYALLILMAAVAVYMALGNPHFRNVDPPGSSGRSRDSTQNETATFTVARDHTFYWDKSGPFPIDEFRSRLADWLKTVNQPHVSIASDGTASFGDAALLINEARRQGIEHIGIETHVQERP